MDEEPSRMKAGKVGGLDAGTEGRKEAQQERKRQEEDAERKRPVSPVDEQKREAEHEAEDGLGLVGGEFHDARQAVVGGVEHLSQGDEVEQQRKDRHRDGEVAPPRAVIQGRRDHREGGDAVQEDRDSKPKEGHYA